MPFQAAIVVTLGAAYAVLAGQSALSPRRLRLLEFAVFGLTAAFLAARQYQGMIQLMTEPGGVLEGASVVSAARTARFGTMMLTFAYCMLIPNTWRSAAAVALAITAVPVVTELALFQTHPGSYDRVRQFATVERVADDVVLMLIACGLSVYGTHVIYGLRKEAFEARQVNQYRLIRKLGAGGMGEVYLAEHRLMKRPCAVKLIRPESATALALARFEREVRATARLSHPNTVEIFDYGRTEDRTFYYVMEYLPGLSLAELVRRHGTLPAGRVIYLVRQACEALAQAHRTGLIHRDIKPANIIAAVCCGRYDVAKLLDFGLVKESAGPDLVSLSREGSVAGTPHYMAPEQVIGDRPLDHRCDLYALGGVAYTLLTGRPPFEGTSAARVMLAHVHGTVVPPSQLRSDIPDDLERVVLRCLAKRPDDRYPDAESLGSALASCSASSEWDSRRAERWWIEFGSDAISSGFDELAG
jgi:serine/threonine-protein kinase